MTNPDSTNDMLHVFQWKNGEKEFSPFSAAEMDRRQNAMRAHLSAKDIDAAIFTSYHGICYYSGFLYCYFGRKFGFVLTQDAATTVSPGSMAASPGGAAMATTSSIPTGAGQFLHSSEIPHSCRRPPRRHRVRPRLARFSQAARRRVSRRRIR
jgi:Xaa-Pro aminopeptidase